VTKTKEPKVRSSSLTGVELFFLFIFSFFLVVSFSLFFSWKLHTDRYPIHLPSVKDSRLEKDHVLKQSVVQIMVCVLYTPHQLQTTMSRAVGNDPEAI